MENTSGVKIVAVHKLSDLFKKLKVRVLDELKGES